MKRSLDFRKKQIESAPTPSYSAVQSYALDFRSHFESLFDRCRESVDNALNWVKLDLGSRARHAIKLVKHALSFKGMQDDVQVTIAKNNSETKNTLGSCSTDGKKITIYESALTGSHDRLVNVAAHETEHGNQIAGKSETVSKETVQICTENYVSPKESRWHYKINPIERGAHWTGETVSDEFTKSLEKKKKRNLFMFDNYYQKVA